LRQAEVRKGLPFSSKSKGLTPLVFVEQAWEWLASLGIRQSRGVADYDLLPSSWVCGNIFPLSNNLRLTASSKFKYTKHQSVAEPVFGSNPNQPASQKPPEHFFPSGDWRQAVIRESGPARLKSVAKLHRHLTVK
jgi:hypothetical protein